MRRDGVSLPSSIAELHSTWGSMEASHQYAFQTQTSIRKVMPFCTTEPAAPDNHGPPQTSKSPFLFYWTWSDPRARPPSNSSLHTEEQKKTHNGLIDSHVVAKRDGLLPPWEGGEVTYTNENQIKPLHMLVHIDGSVFKARSTVCPKSFRKYLVETGPIAPDAAT